MIGKLGLEAQGIFMLAMFLPRLIAERSWYRSLG
jgi:hypothetical protein